MNKGTKLTKQTNYPPEIAALESALLLGSKLRKHYRRTGKAGVAMQWHLIISEIFQGLWRCRERYDSVQWRPIETAPKDKSCLLWCEGEVEVGHWSTSLWVTAPGKDGAWIIYENRSDTIELSPTHWMPLPHAPAK